jgi:hypothetical protein
LGGRYFLLGTQIGMLRAFAKMENESDINKLLDEVEDKQYMCEKEEFEKKQKKHKPKKIIKIIKK